MKNNSCFVTRGNDQWCTPTNIYRYYVLKNNYYDFNPYQPIVEVDSLKLDFKCDLYCNPPYSNIEPFVDYMINHFNKGFKVVMLLPSRTGTKWFKKIICTNKATIKFFTQRLHFNDKGCAPFDCFIVELDLRNSSNSFQFINRDLEVC